MTQSKPSTDHRGHLKGNKRKLPTYKNEDKCRKICRIWLARVLKGKTTVSMPISEQKKDLKSKIEASDLKT